MFKKNTFITLTARQHVAKTTAESPIKKYKSYILLQETFNMFCN